MIGGSHSVCILKVAKKRRSLECDEVQESRRYLKSRIRLCLS